MLLLLVVLLLRFVRLLRVRVSIVYEYFFYEAEWLIIF
jgi:hypothetical protein